MEAATRGEGGRGQLAKEERKRGRKRGREMKSKRLAYLSDGLLFIFNYADRKPFSGHQQTLRIQCGPIASSTVLS